MNCKCWPKPFDIDYYQLRVRATAGEKSRLIIEMLKEEVHKDENKKKENERKHSHVKFDLKRITAYADSIQRPSVSSSVESVVEGNIHMLGTFLFFV